MAEGACGDGESTIEELERKVKTMGNCTEVAALITSTPDFDDMTAVKIAYGVSR